MKQICLILVLMYSVCFYCLVVKEWGETCNHTDECYDPRMLCIQDIDSISKCLCNRFHKWDSIHEECIQIYSVLYIMNKTVSSQDNEGKLNRTIQFLYKGPIFSVYFMVFILCSCVVSVIIYCTYVRIKDSRLKTMVRKQLEKKKANVAEPGTSTTEFMTDRSTKSKRTREIGQVSTV